MAVPISTTFICKLINIHGWYSCFPRPWNDVPQPRSPIISNVKRLIHFVISTTAESWVWLSSIFCRSLLINESTYCLIIGSCSLTAFSENAGLKVLRNRVWSAVGAEMTLCASTPCGLVPHSFGRKKSLLRYISHQASGSMKDNSLGPMRTMLPY